MTQLGSPLVFRCAHYIKLLLCQYTFESSLFFYININIQFKCISPQVFRSTVSFKNNLVLLFNNKMVVLHLLPQAPAPAITEQMNHPGDL